MQCWATYQTFEWETFIVQSSSIQTYCVQGSLSFWEVIKGEFLTPITYCHQVLLSKCHYLLKPALSAFSTFFHLALSIWGILKFPHGACLCSPNLCVYSQSTCSYFCGCTADTACMGFSGAKTCANNYIQTDWTFGGWLWEIYYNTCVIIFFQCFTIRLESDHQAWTKC